MKASLSLMDLYSCWISNKKAYTEIQTRCSHPAPLQDTVFKDPFHLASSYLLVLLPCKPAVT